MITQLITELSGAFGKVVDLVGKFLGDEGVFGAIGDLSSSIF